LIEATAGTQADGELRRRLIATCPACKRAHDVTQIAGFGVERQMESR
jgi:hydrogenase-4 component H